MGVYYYHFRRALMVDAHKETDGEMDTQTRKLRTELLGETLRFAVEHAPFYRSRIGEHLAGIKDIEDLSKLPTMGKNELARYGREMLTSREFPARIGLTSGTTYDAPNASGIAANNAPPELSPPIVTYQSDEEIELHASLSERLSLREDGVTSLSLMIHNAHHGDKFTRTPQGTLLVPLEKYFHFAHIENLLRSDFDFPGFSHHIEFISGSLSQLKLLSFLIEKYSPGLLDRRPLRGIFSNGFFVSKRWRALLEKAYQTTLVDIYGISEIAGANAAECRGCGAFHMPPFIIPEVVSPFSDDERISAGYGELVLTSLFPFTKLQPLIRYRTGDVIRITDGCELVDDLGFMPVGRIRKSVIDRRRGVLLPSALVLELIDELPEAAREASTVLKLFSLDSQFGTPRYTLEAVREEDGTIRAVLTLELNFNPRFFEPRAASIVEHLSVECCALTGCAKEAAAQGALKMEVRVVAPGTLRVAPDTFHDRD